MSTSDLDAPNPLLAQATTSVAFALTLSKHQCNVLLRIAASGEPDMKIDSRVPASQHLHLVVPYVQVAQMQSLERKGLCWWARDEETGRSKGFRGLTTAGHLVVGLLKEAGLTIENTNTAATLRRAAA